MFVLCLPNHIQPGSLLVYDLLLACSTTLSTLPFFLQKRNVFLQAMVLKQNILQFSGYVWVENEVFLYQQSEASHNCTYDNVALSLSALDSVVHYQQYFWLLAPLLMHRYMYGAGKRESKSSREAGAIYQGEFAAIFGFIGCACIPNSQEGIMSSLNVELHASRFSEAFQRSFGYNDHTTKI